MFYSELEWSNEKKPCQLQGCVDEIMKKEPRHFAVALVYEQNLYFFKLTSYLTKIFFVLPSTNRIILIPLTGSSTFAPSIV